MEPAIVHFRADAAVTHERMRAIVEVGPGEICHIVIAPASAIVLSPPGDGLARSSSQAEVLFRLCGPLSN